MGKDYGGRAWEVLSMGLQGLYFDTYDTYNEDQEYFDFILGLVAAF